jgi:hypothetical protein
MPTVWRLVSFWLFCLPAGLFWALTGQEPPLEKYPLDNYYSLKTTL